MKTIRRKLKQALMGKWEVRKLLFPYPEGYGTYHTGKRTLLDTGLSKEQAQQICDELNCENTSQLCNH